MLRWCAYCQEFQGEVAPFDIFHSTHGICTSCRSKGMARLDDEIGLSRVLVSIQERLYKAGRAGDVDAAALIVTDAIATGLRPIDILLGLITPLLYKVGDEWEHGGMSIAEEHRFTAFCETVFALVTVGLAETRAASESSQPVILLMNASGNEHTVAIRMLALWLNSYGYEATVLEPSPTSEQLIKIIRIVQPTAVLISLALAEQRDAVVHLVERLTAAFPTARPEIIVGGYAIKLQMIQPIPGSIFLNDISELTGVIGSLEPAIP